MTEHPEVTKGQVEAVLRRASFADAEADLQDRTLRIRVPDADMARILEPRTRMALLQDLKALGIAYIALDLQPIREV